MSSRGSVLRGSVRSRNCPFGEMSVGEVSVGEVSVGDLSSAKCPVGELSYNPCNGPTDVIMSSGRVDKITFPTILLSASPTPIGHNPGFLSNRIRWQDRKSSRVFARSLSMSNFFIILAMVVHKSIELSADYLDVRILFQNWLHFLRFDFGSAVF